MKFGVWLWYAIRKKRLTFGGDPDPDSAAGFRFIISFLYDAKPVQTLSIVKGKESNALSFIDLTCLHPLQQSALLCGGSF